MGCEHDAVNKKVNTVEVAFPIVCRLESHALDSYRARCIPCVPRHRRRSIRFSCTTRSNAMVAARSIDPFLVRCCSCFFQSHLSKKTELAASSMHSGVLFPYRNSGDSASTAAGLEGRGGFDFLGGRSSLLLLLLRLMLLCGCSFRL